MRDKRRKEIATILGMALIEKLEAKAAWDRSEMETAPERKAHKRFLAALTRYRIVENQVRKELFPTPEAPDAD